MIESTDLLSVLFVTSHYLDSGRWSLVAVGKEIPVAVYIDIPALRRKEFVGLKIVGAANVEKFVNACFGLFPWDGFAKSEYFNDFLIEGLARPSVAVFKS